MSKITASPNIAQVDDSQVKRFTDQFCQNVVQVVNGKLDFASNFNAQTIQVNFTTINQTFGFPHSLGRIPVGYIRVGGSGGNGITDGNLPSTVDIIYLKATVVGVAKLLIF